MKASPNGTVRILASEQIDPVAVAIDATHVYWASQGDRGIHRIPVGGGPVETIARTRGAPTDIAVDERHVYWVESAGKGTADGSVMRAGREGGSAKALAIGQRPLRLAMDARYVYWMNQGEGVMRGAK